MEVLRDRENVVLLKYFSNNLSDRLNEAEHVCYTYFLWGRYLQFVLLRAVVKTEGAQHHTTDFKTLE